MSDDDDDLVPVDMNEVNRLVAKQDFTGLQHTIVHTNNVGADIIVLLAMCTLLHTEVKALRERLTELTIHVKGHPQ